MIELTNLAREKLRELLKENPGKFARIIIDGFGWGGPRLGLTLDEPKNNESAIQVNDINFLISDELKPYADISIINYRDLPNRKGFAIIRKGPGCCWYSVKNIIKQSVTLSCKDFCGVTQNKFLPDCGINGVDKVSF
jgi:Fe-S cluster assembly iron-binding protein IscA